MPDVKVFYPMRILSSTNSPDLLNWVRENLDEGHLKLLINFQDVLFMDSMGLAALVTASKAVRKAGGTLAICSLSGQARMLIEMADVGTLFELYETFAAFKSAA